MLITSRFYFHFFFQVGSPLYSVCCWAYCCLVGHVYSHSPRKNKKPYSHKNAKKVLCYWRDYTFEQNKGWIQKEPQDQDRKYCYGNTFLFIIGRANKRTLFRGNQNLHHGSENVYWLDSVLFLFFPSWKRICVHALCSARGQTGKHFAAKSFIN